MKLSQRLFQNQSGMSILIVLIALAIVTAISINFTGQSQIETKKNIRLRQDFDFEVILNEIRLVLAERSTCALAFVKDDGTSATFGRVDNSDNTSALLPATLHSLIRPTGTSSSPILTIGDDTISLKNFNIKLVYEIESSTNEAIPPKVDLQGNIVTHFVELIIEAERENTNGNKISNFNNPIRLKLTTLIDPPETDQIFDCEVIPP